MIISATPELREKWAQLTKNARSNMETAEQQNGPGRILITVGAQHPLENGCKPGPAFQARLDEAIRLYNELTEQGNHVDIFVPGSRHSFNGKHDEISLSEAGTNYLLEQGIPNDHLHGVEACKHYRGEFGVYNSSDETFVGAELFHDHGYTQLIAIISPVQAPRVELLYIYRGVLPKVIPVSIEDAVHGWVGEILEVLPQVLENPDYMDDPTSERCQKHRKGRVPEDGRMW